MWWSMGARRVTAASCARLPTSASLLRLCTLVAVVALAMSPGARAGRDFYKILGVDRDVSTRSLKKAYRRLSLKYHPDKQVNPTKAEAKVAQDKFMEISEAFGVLNDPEKRRVYDQWGEEGLDDQQSGGGGGGRDPFSMFHNFGFGQRRQARPQRGPDVRIRVEVPLREVYLGSTRTFVYDKLVTCSHCRGTGADNPNHVHKCPVCGGSGKTIQRQQLGPGFYQQVHVTCNHCGGKGRVAQSTCHVCGGQKVEKGRSTHELVVERGMADGTEIVFEHAADESPDHAAGHLVLVLAVVNEEGWRRSGNDLHIDHVISLRESLLGFSHEVTHFDGRKVVVRRAGVTPPDYVLRISGEGMPHHNFPSDKGDLHVHIRVELPRKLTPEQQAGFRALGLGVRRA